MTFFLIRHVATQRIMPQMKRGRGYSHWNPGVDGAKSEAELYSAMPGVPRLLTSRKQAQSVINLWSIYPNATTRRYERSMLDSYGSDEEFITKPDGRKKDDLEIVPAALIIEEHALKLRVE